MFWRFFMVEKSPAEIKKHSLTLSNCQTLFLDGISEVLNFDDTLISLVCPRGELSIEGNSLRITKYLMQSGEMAVEGVITAIIYSDGRNEAKTGLFSRFKR